MKRDLNNQQQNPRENWMEKFKDSKLLSQTEEKLIPDVFDNEDFEDWTW